MDARKIREELPFLIHEKKLRMRRNLKDLYEAHQAVRGRNQLLASVRADEVGDMPNRGVERLEEYGSRQQKGLTKRPKVVFHKQDLGRR